MGKTSARNCPAMTYTHNCKWSTPNPLHLTPHRGCVDASLGFTDKLRRTQPASMVKLPTLHNVLKLWHQTAASKVPPHPFLRRSEQCYPLTAAVGVPSHLPAPRPRSPINATRSHAACPWVGLPEAHNGGTATCYV